MTKKISEVIIKVTGKGLKTVNADISKLQASIEETSAAAKGLHAALEEGGRSDAILNRIASSAERSEKEFQQLNKTSVNTLKLLNAQLEQTAFATEEARDAANGLGSVFKGTGRDVNGLNNRLKDTNRQGTNQVRTFSKMARSAGGLTMIYAAIAANVFALSEAFRLMNEASSVSRLSNVADVMSNEMGVSIKGTANALYEATDAAVSYQEALRLAAASAAYGFDTEQMEKLAVVAKRASVVLGVDMQDALRRVTRGIAKQEVELLDELGLTVRLNEAFSAYAATHGLAVKSLNAFQRQQALTNAVITKSQHALGAADKALSSTEWEKFGAEVSTSVNSLLQVISSSDLVTGALAKVTAGVQGLREAAGDSTTLIAANHTGGVKAVADNLQTPGALQAKAADPKDTRALVSAYTVVTTEIAKATEQLEKMKDTSKETTWFSELFYSNEQGTTKEFAVQSLTLAGLLEIQRRLAEQTRLISTEASVASDSFRELNLLGQSFSGDVAKYGNELFGTADQQIQTQIDEINAAVARASTASLGQFSNKELLGAAKTTSEVMLGRAKSIADYQKLTIDYKTQELGILNSGVRGEEQKQVLAQASLDLATARLVILHREKASSATILATTKEKLAAEETLRGIEEAKLQRSSAAYELTERHAVRNENAVAKAEEELQIALMSQDMAKESNATSDEYLRSLNNIVIAKDRALQIAKEQSKEEEKAAYFSIAGDLSSNIGSLNSGMGETAAGLTSMAQGWDDLGNKAKSSAEKIKAASQIAGGFQAALGGMINAASSMVASGIDAEIAAVKNSGMTQEQEEKKVRQLQKKKIKEQEKYTKASIILNTAMGVARSLGELPFPANFVIAGLTAAAGAMAYQQASNTAASQLASLGGGASSAASNMEVTVGKASTPSTDVSTSASSGERSQMLGDRGVYGRASAGTMKANTPYLTSESGRELVIPKADSKIVNSTETENILSSRGGNTFAPVIQVSALDAQSLEERMPDILSMLQEQAEQQGFSLGS